MWALSLIAVFSLLISLCFIIFRFQRTDHSPGWNTTNSICCWTEFTGSSRYLRLIYICQRTQKIYSSFFLLSYLSGCLLGPATKPTSQQTSPIFSAYILIQLTDNPTVPQHESRSRILLPSLFGSKAHSNNARSEESQTAPSSPRRPSSNSTVLRASTWHARASLSRPNSFHII